MSCLVSADHRSAAHTRKDISTSLSRAGSDVLRAGEACQVVSLASYWYSQTAATLLILICKGRPSMQAYQTHSAGISCRVVALYTRRRAIKGADRARLSASPKPHVLPLEGFCAISSWYILALMPAGACKAGRQNIGQRGISSSSKTAAHGTETLATAARSARLHRSRGTSKAPHSYSQIIFFSYRSASLWG